MFPSFPFPFAGVVARLRLLHCARVATTVEPTSNTSSDGTNSDALDALLDGPLLDEALDMDMELDDELRLQLELELELELILSYPPQALLLLPYGFGRQEWVKIVYSV